MTRPRLLLALLAVLVFLAGCSTAKPPSAMDQPLVARFYMELRQGVPGAVAMQLPVSKIVVNVNPKPVLVEYDIADAAFAKVDLGWCLFFRFTTPARLALLKLSDANRGGALVLTLNGQPVGVRRLEQTISEGSLLMFVELQNDELPPVAERIKRTSAKLQKDAR